MLRLISILSFLFFFSLSSCSKKKEADAPTVVPSVSIQDASQERFSSNTMVSFSVTLDKATTKAVSVDYTISDGTAKSPKDYTSKTGTITFNAGQVIAQLSVEIKGDANNTREDNLTFTVQLSNPKDCKLGIFTATGTIITENGTSLSTSNTGYSTPTTYPGYTMVWSNEFSNPINASEWNMEIGNGSGGWGNNELEYYTSSNKNSFVSNGNLIIEARKEAISGFNYSSARMTTQGKKSFTFGRVDIRAKLPKGKGIWPALWMLGSNISTVGWPSCGEIDIMELVGHEPNKVHGTAHWKPVNGTSINKGNSSTLASGDYSQEFHVFSIIWVRDSIKWLIDDKEYFTLTKADVGNANYPFNDPQFFIFNVAVGGNWPGSPDASTVFPQRMFVDYIRVFQ
jgi:beta-glucanase (GH16 family)